MLFRSTAFMDPENEEKMNAAIAEVIKDKTVIVIAHHLHSIINAHQICVLKNGYLNAVGTHQELIDTCLEYQKLWTMANNSANWRVSHNQGGN